MLSARDGMVNKTEHSTVFVYRLYYSGGVLALTHNRTNNYANSQEIKIECQCFEDMLPEGLREFYWETYLFCDIEEGFLRRQ